eukprot:6030069-Prymnesium_polylepis.1
MPYSGGELKGAEHARVLVLLLRKKGTKRVIDIEYSTTQLVPPSPFLAPFYRNRTPEPNKDSTLCAAVLGLQIRMSKHLRRRGRQRQWRASPPRGRALRSGIDGVDGAAPPARTRQPGDRWGG